MYRIFVSRFLLLLWMKSYVDQLLNEFFYKYFDNNDSALTI